MEVRALEAPGSPEGEGLLLRLWAEAFGPRWPMSAAFLRETLALDRARPGGVLLAWLGGEPVGFAFAQIAFGGHDGSLLALGVLPGRRRRGVGRALHRAALQFLREHGALCVGLGTGSLRYFWPGVPLEEGGSAWPFFAALGYPEIWRAADLWQPLAEYATPGWVWERVAGSGLEIGPARPEERQPVLEMVAAELPQWSEFYTAAFDAGREADIVIARAGEGPPLGACLLDCAAPRWAACFEEPVAAPGCVLTAEYARGMGVGLAVTARATEMARERGCRTGFIGYTDLASFYEKLGFRLWQKYIMSEREE